MDEDRALVLLSVVAMFVLALPARAQVVPKLGLKAEIILVKIVTHNRPVVTFKVSDDPRLRGS